MANELYRVLGTKVSWLNTGGDEQLDLGDGVIGVSGAVGVGSYHDFGSGAQPDGFILWVDIDGFDTAPVVGETIEVYIVESDDATLWSGPESPSDTVDSAGAVDRLPNLLGPYIATVRSTTAGDNVSARFEYRSTARYQAPAVYNKTSDNFLTTGDAHAVTITPFYYQVQ